MCVRVCACMWVRVCVCVCVRVCVPCCVVLSAVLCTISSSWKREIFPRMKRGLSAFGGRVGRSGQGQGLAGQREAARGSPDHSFGVHGRQGTPAAPRASVSPGPGPEPSSGSRPLGGGSDPCVTAPGPWAPNSPPPPPRTQGHLPWGRGARGSRVTQRAAPRRPTPGLRGVTTSAVQTGRPLWPPESSRYPRRGVTPLLDTGCPHRGTSRGGGTVSNGGTGPCLRGPRRALRPVPRVA